MFKTSLLINELTCRIGNAILLVVICWLSALRACEIPLAVTGCVSALSHERTCAHYFAHYLKVTVKIHTLGSIVPVALTSFLVWRDSP